MVANSAHADSLSMSKAFLRFLPAEWAENGRMHQELAAGRPSNDPSIKANERILWGQIAIRAKLAGDLVITGRRQGSLQMEQIPGDLACVAAPDLDAGTLSLADGLVFYDVHVAPAPVAAEPPPLPTPPVKTGARSYAEDDRPFVDLMVAALKDGEAAGPMDAAQLVVSQHSASMVGSGTDDSKVKRLLRSYNGLVRDQSGQS